VATTTLDQLIEQTRLKANVTRSNFATDAEIIGYLNEARKQFRELVVAADDSYYQDTLDFSIGAAPLNVQALPSTFWKLRGLDAFAGDSLRQKEVFAREFRNRFDPGVGYYFGGTGNSIVVCGLMPEQANPYRIYFTPKPLPLAALAPGVSRTIEHAGGDGTTAGSQLGMDNGNFRAGDVGGTLVISASGTPCDGTYSVLTVDDPTRLTTIPALTPSQTFGDAVVTLTGADDATRTFALVPGFDSQASGFWALQNGDFGDSDVGAYLSVVIDTPFASLSGTYQILAVNGPTSIRVSPAVAGTIAPLAGTATISRQPGGTESALDLTEDNFSEYFSVRAAMVIARKKRQDTLVAQLGAERAAIEERISALSRMRQSEPQQAPVLWGRRSTNYDDWEV
jgi:hypothetical protein